MSEATLHKRKTKLTEQKNNWKAIAMHLNKGKWGAVILVKLICYVQV